MKTYENFINNNNPKIEYYSNGQKELEEWSLNGKRHREDGPAYQWWYENGQKEFEIWYLNDKYHREDGPAVKWWYLNGKKSNEQWFLNDKEYTREEWVEKLKEIDSPHYDEQKMLLNVDKYNI